MKKLLLSLLCGASLSAFADTAQVMTKAQLDAAYNSTEKLCSQTNNTQQCIAEINQQGEIVDANIDLIMNKFMTNLEDENSSDHIGIIDELNYSADIYNKLITLCEKFHVQNQVKIKQKPELKNMLNDLKA